MFFFFLFFWFQVFGRDLTPEQIEQIKAQIQERMNNREKGRDAGDMIETDISPPLFAPSRSGVDASDFDSGINGKAWGGGGSDIGGPLGPRSIEFLPQRGCRCFSGCPFCEGDCGDNCGCIFKLPSESRWVWGIDGKPLCLPHIEPSCKPLYRGLYRRPNRRRILGRTR